MIDTFSVWQFFEDGSQEQVRHAVPADEAAKAYAHYTQSVGARLGTTVRVIVTDDGDSIVLEWEFGKGHTFPREYPMWKPRRRRNQPRIPGVRRTPVSASLLAEIEECIRADMKMFGVSRSFVIATHLAAMYNIRTTDYRKPVLVKKRA